MGSAGAIAILSFISSVDGKVCLPSGCLYFLPGKKKKGADE